MLYFHPRNETRTSLQSGYLRCRTIGIAFIAEPSPQTTFFRQASSFLIFASRQHKRQHSGLFRCFSVAIRIANDISSASPDIVQHAFQCASPHYCCTTALIISLEAGSRHNSEQTKVLSGFNVRGASAVQTNTESSCYMFFLYSKCMPAMNLQKNHIERHDNGYLLLCISAAVLDLVTKKQRCYLGWTPRRSASRHNSCRLRCNLVIDV